MYVLADVEWVTNPEGLISFTQIAMIRVDEKWKLFRGISRRIRPKDTSFHQWDHMAFTGGSKENFLEAPSFSQAFFDITKWLWPSDTICWWSNESKEFIQKMVPTITNRQIVINERVAAFLRRKLSNPYQLGKSMKLIPPGEKHNSRNDVEMMRLVLEAIHFPQPIPEIIVSTQTPRPAPNLSEYIAHIETNRIHKKGCAQLPTSGGTKSYNELTRLVGKGYVPCDCVKEEYRAARRTRNQSIIDRSEYNFIYSPDSRVFHRRNCKIALNAKQLLGTVQYHKCAATGRHPCLVCNPKPEHETRKYVTSGASKYPNYIKQAGALQAEQLKSYEQRAVNRHRQALEQRRSFMRNASLTDEKRQDLKVLSQPNYAFFAAKGYRNFHLRNCKKLSGLTNVEGFGRYFEANRAGYQPCKCCKPTDKHDIVVSLPIYSTKRYAETKETLPMLCANAHILYWEEKELSYLRTDAGIWRLSTAKTPYRLEHINLIKTPNNYTEFHRQPRLFLSFADVVRYIKKHDGDLLKVNKQAECVATAV